MYRIKLIYVCSKISKYNTNVVSESNYRNEIEIYFEYLYDFFMNTVKIQNLFRIIISMILLNTY